jgi:hypothetical protein
MSTRIGVAVIAAVLLGSASPALADDQFDVNIYRPTIQDNPVGRPGIQDRPIIQDHPLGAYAQSPPLMGGGKGAVLPFTAGEKALFDRASQLH